MIVKTKTELLRVKNLESLVQRKRLRSRKMWIFLVSVRIGQFIIIMVNMNRYPITIKITKKVETKMESEEFNKFGAAEIINIPEDMELS
ncbi:hypothetical protein L2E82_15623 [Cichorium intybus]|uniref:Uncharacterized protein n=1 Tax=Cichorium intybus TaxID=13427 RepID=A0ACB9F3B2_CICIN|nr:hypothetical protein L2E82_15623 [Cichorium intybus]